MNKESIKCGIVVLNYNSYELTVNLVNKISNFSAIDEICVVDNNSNDNFENIFSSKKVHYIKNKVNSGYSAGNNIGLRYLVEEKNCNILFIANPDTIFGNETIEVMISNMQENSDIALISCKRFGHNNQIIHQYFDFPTLKTSIKNCFFIPRRKFESNRHIIQNKNVDNADKLFYVDAVPGSLFGIKKEFLLKIGYIYEGIFLYGEELVLGRQAHELGYKCAITNLTTYFHNHEQKRFDNIKALKNDKKSLKIYFNMFEKISWYKKLALDIAIFLGSLEYSIAYYIYHFTKKFERRK